MLQLIDPQQWTFVDFGCGLGVTMITAMTYPFIAVDGIELDVETARGAQSNVNICLSKPSTQCIITRVLNMDMQEYAFPASPTVLFMFEPLAFVEVELAKSVYSKVVSNAQKAGVELIIYLEGRKNVAIPIFESHGFLPICCGTVYDIVGGDAAAACIFKRGNREFQMGNRSGLDAEWELPCGGRVHPVVDTV